MKDINKIHTNQVYCPLAWYSLTGQKSGKIGICCMNNLGCSDLELGHISQKSFSELWNGEKMKKIRLNMLQGMKSAYCEPCYRKESFGLESLRTKAIGYYGDQTKNFIECTSDNGEYDGSIQKLDLRLSNLCNLACRMCTGDSSTSRIELDKSLGIQTMTDAYTNEPYDTENFWSDIEKLSQVHTFKFAGGEPLMNPNFYKLLEKLIILGKANTLRIEILTNLTVLPGINGYKNFLFGDYGNIFEILGEFQSCQFQISIDGYEKSYEYIRIGSNWDNVKKNILSVHEISKAQKKFSIGFMPTVQKDNIYDFPKLYLFAHSRDIWIDIKPLVRPEYLSIIHLSEGEKEKITQYYNACIKKYKNKAPKIEKDLNYILQYMNSHASKDEYIKQYYEKSKIMDAFAEGKNKNLS